MTPKESRNLKIGIGIAAAAIGIYLFSQSSDTGGESSDPTGNNGNAGNVSDFDANQVRLALFHAMNQLGTDENTIVQTLRYVTPAQFDKVITAFAKERYNDFFGYKTAGAPERDLLYWLNAEMADSSEYANLKRKFKRLY